MVRPSRPDPKPRPALREFDVEQFLGSAGLARRLVTYRRGQIIFRQGEAADTVLFLRNGTVKLSVVSARGKQAVFAVLGPGTFFGEGALTSATRRLSHATSIETSHVLVIDKDEMAKRLREHPALAARFITHLLERNTRVEADLVDHLFNTSEKRLARMLLLLARYGTEAGPDRTLPRISQEALAEMVGTTRSRMNYFMNKFRRLGLVDYNGRIVVHSALLGVVLLD